MGKFSDTRFLMYNKNQTPLEYIRFDEMSEAMSIPTNTTGLLKTPLALSASLQVVEDYAGTDSPLYLSTTAIGLGTTSIWDNATGRLGIGTTSPTQKLDVTGRGRFSQSVNTDYHNDATNNISIIAFIGSSTNAIYDGSGSQSMFVIGQKIGINKSSSLAAQLDVVAASATVGLYVKGAASTDIARFYTSAGSLNAYFNSDGQLNIPSQGIQSGGGVKDNNNSWGVAWANSNTWGMRGDTGLIGFGSGSNGAGSLDTAISRNAAGVMEVNTGTVGTLGSINVAGYKVNGNAGFTGTGIFTTLTIEGGIITAAS